MRPVSEDRKNLLIRELVSCALWALMSVAANKLKVGGHPQVRLRTLEEFIFGKRCFGYTQHPLGSGVTPHELKQEGLHPRINTKHSLSNVTGVNERTMGALHSQTLSCSVASGPKKPSVFTLLIGAQLCYFILMCCFP